MQVRDARTHVRACTHGGIGAHAPCAPARRGKTVASTANSTRRPPIVHRSMVVEVGVQQRLWAAPGGSQRSRAVHSAIRTSSGIMSKNKQTTCLHVLQSDFASCTSLKFHALVCGQVQSQRPTRFPLTWVRTAKQKLSASHMTRGCAFGSLNCQQKRDNYTTSLPHGNVIASSYIASSRAPYFSSLVFILLRACQAIISVHARSAPASALLVEAGQNSSNVACGSVLHP
jgi:hypothetical protein